MNDQGPPEEMVEHWDAFIDDVEATAAEYRERDWEVLELHPGGVVPRSGPAESEGGDGADEDAAPERVGFEVMVPDDEFDALEAFLAERFVASNYETFRADVGDVAFTLVVERDEDADRAVLVPLFYRSSVVAKIEEQARERDELVAYVRPASRENVVTFSHEEPGQFFEAFEPAGDAGSAPEGDDDRDGDSDGDDAREGG